MFTIYTIQEGKEMKMNNMYIKSVYSVSKLQECSPVSVLVTAELKQSVGERAPLASIQKSLKNSNLVHNQYNISVSS